MMDLFDPATLIEGSHDMLSNAMYFNPVSRKVKEEKREVGIEFDDGFDVFDSEGFGKGMHNDRDDMVDVPMYDVVDDAVVKKERDVEVFSGGDAAVEYLENEETLYDAAVEYQDNEETLFDALPSLPQPLRIISTVAASLSEAEDDVATQPLVEVKEEQVVNGSDEVTAEDNEEMMVDDIEESRDVNEDKLLFIDCDCGSSCIDTTVLKVRFLVHSYFRHLIWLIVFRIELKVFSI